MGCCWSREEDPFGERSALLAKRQNDASDVTKAKMVAAGHYGKPVTPTASPSSVKPASNGSSASNSGSKTPTEKVQPVKVVDLLGLDQPPSPAVTTGEANEEEEEEDEDMILRKLQKRLSKKLSAKDLAPESPKEALSDLMPPRPAPFKEQLSDLMPPRPSVPPHVLAAMKKRAEEAEAKAKAAAASVEVAAAASSAVEESTDADDTEGDGDTGEETTPSSMMASTNGGSSATKSSKKKKGKKKGKK